MAQIRDTCSCGAEIAWVRHRAKDGAGHVMMPIDAEPNPDGNVILSGDERHAQVLGATSTALAALRNYEGGRRIFMPHHATCPDVEHFRRR